MKNQHKELIERLRNHATWLEEDFNQYQTSFCPIIDDLELAANIIEKELQDANNGNQK